MELKEIAAVSGKGGLFRIVQPTRTGVILESLDEAKNRVVANGNDRLSILSEIAIYTTTSEGSTPLSEVFNAVKAQYPGELPVNAKSDANALKSFMLKVLPDYDANRVYQSDIKKLVTWYASLNTLFPELFVSSVKSEEASEVETKPKKKATKTKEAK